MRLPTQSTLAFATLFSALATCGAAPDVASDPPTGTIAAGSTTSVPATADPGDLYRGGVGHAAVRSHWRDAHAGLDRSGLLHRRRAMC